jgi:hypothetical protein
VLQALRELLPLLRIKEPQVHRVDKDLQEPKELTMEQQVLKELKARHQGLQVLPVSLDQQVLVDHKVLRVLREDKDSKDFQVHKVGKDLQVHKGGQVQEVLKEPKVLKVLHLIED